MSHSHFTLSDRIRIQHGIECNKSNREIAQCLGVSHTAINQEIRQNSVVLEVVTTSRVNKPRILSLDLRTRRGKGEVPDKEIARKRYQQRLTRWERGQPTYVASVAQTLYLERRASASQGNRILDDGNLLAEKITALLMSKAKDSPEQIAADLRKQDICISHQTIYRWIKRSSDQKVLEKRLRRRGRRYHYAVTTQQAWNKSKAKRSIHSRPVVIEKLIRYGDLEGDTIFGEDTKDRLLTHVDRVTGLLSLSLVLGYDSYKIHKQTTQDIARVFGTKIRSVTYDNGSEFAAWRLTERAIQSQSSDKRIKAKIYFADPYRSSQRGRNENTNGLVRDYFPKGTDFKKITKQQVMDAENILNNRSRKRYNWRSPFEQRAFVLSYA